MKKAKNEDVWHPVALPKRWEMYAPDLEVLVPIVSHSTTKEWISPAPSHSSQATFTSLTLVFLFVITVDWVVCSSREWGFLFRDLHNSWKK